MGEFLCVVLTIIFVIAKILKLITWSWWLVFTPTIILFIGDIISVILDAMNDY